METLTERELEVLAHALLLNRQIAARLGTSHKTVANQFTSIYRKLDLRVGKSGGRVRRTAAVVKALKLGLLGFDDFVWPEDGDRWDDTFG